MTNPTERLASLLKCVPSDYFSFGVEKSPAAKEVFDAMRALSDAELRDAMRGEGAEIGSVPL